MTPETTQLKPLTPPRLFDGLIAKPDAIDQFPGGERAFDRFVAKSKLRRIVIMRHVFFDIEELKAAIRNQGRVVCPEPQRGRPARQAA